MKANKNDCGEPTHQNYMYDNHIKDNLLCEYLQALHGRGSGLLDSERDSEFGATTWYCS